MKSIVIHQYVPSLRYPDANNPTPDQIARRQRFLERYPAQEANILSYQTDPTCKCGGELSAAINNDPKKVENITYVEGEQVVFVSPQMMYGKTMTVDDTEGAWEDLTKRFQAEQMMFRSLTVAPSVDDTGKKILRIFFF